MSNMIVQALKGQLKGLKRKEEKEVRCTNRKLC